MCVPKRTFFSLNPPKGSAVMSSPSSGKQSTQLTKVRPGHECRVEPPGGGHYPPRPPRESQIPHFKGEMGAPVSESAVT